MAAVTLWLWDDTNKLWVKAQCDVNGKLIISDLDPFTVQQTTPMNLRHVPHGYYAAGPSYLPYAVDSAGKLLMSVAALQHLSDIADVNLTGLTTGDFIYWDAATSKWERIAHKDATTAVHGVGAGTVAKVADIAVLANIPNLTQNKMWQGDATNRPVEVATPSGGYTQGARVTHSINVSIANAAYVTLPFDTERWDTDTIHDTVTNNERLTCKTAGKYLIIALASFVSNATGFRVLRIDSSVAGISAMNIVPAVNGIATRMMVSAILDMAVNEYVIALVYQTSGGALDSEQGANYIPEFMMQRIG